MQKIKFGLFTCSLILFLSACGPAPAQETTSRTPAKTVQAYHHKNLEMIFSGYEYTWGKLEQGVPPIILTKFPDDLHLIHSTTEKKELFFRVVLPMAMLANEEILDQRKTINNIFINYDREKFITVQHQNELTVLLKRYRIKSDPLTDLKIRERLLSRVDTIPESLVLAQAANESGWGTSRFTHMANNIFGEWTFTPGTGIVPENRPEGETYEVRRFSNLYQSVRSYMHNLNTHRAYSSLRQIRQELRQTGQPISGIKLSAGLTNYSTRREAYSREIEAMIKTNRLDQITTSTFLRPEATIPSIEIVTTSFGLMGSKEELARRMRDDD